MANIQNDGAGVLSAPQNKEKSSGFARWIKKWNGHPFSALTELLVWLSGIAMMLIMLFLVGFILVRGIGHLSPELFSFTYNSENASLMPALVNTLIITALSLLIAIPFGVFTAIYLVEYAKKGSRLVKLIRITAETLSGIPSIIYGLFGLLFFCTALKWSYCLLAGALTLVIRTSEEALLSVPDAYREASFGLGAGKLRTIFHVVLPTAIPGILSGVILATGRIVGETAALLYTAGSVAKIPNLMGSGRTLAVHMYVLSSEGLYMDQAYATAVVLLVFVLVLNGISNLLAKQLTKGRNA